MALNEYQEKLRYEELSAKNASQRTAAEERELQLLESQLEKWDRISHTADDITQALANQLKYTKQQTEAFRGVVNAFQPLNQKAADLYSTMTALKDPLTAGFKLIELSAKRFVELDNAGRAFRDSTGFLSSQTKEIETNIRQSSRDLSDFGVTVESATAAAGELSKAFGDTAIANKENIEYVSLMKENLGVSADDSVSLMQNFMGIGGMTSKIARETAGAAASLAKAAGVPFKEVMKDVAKPSETVRALIRGSVDGLIKGAIEAKRLGTTLEAVGKAAAGFLDFQSSVNDEMEASVLFGKDVNLQKARELAYAGDLKGLAKEQNKLIQEAGDVSKMDYFQRQGIAKALGMTIEEMDKMNAKQKEMNTLRTENPELYKQLTADLDVIDKTNESLTEKYQKELKSQQIASQQEKIMNSINSIMVELADALLPVINTLMPIVGILFKISVILIKFILAPFRLLNDAIDYFFKTFSGAKQTFDDFGNMINKSFSDILNPDNLAGKVTLFVLGLAGLITTALMGGTIMGLITSAISSPFKLAFKLIPNYFKGAISKLPTSVQNIAGKFMGGSAGDAPVGGTSGTAAVGKKLGRGKGKKLTAAASATSAIPAVPPTATPTAGQNIKEFLTNLSDGIKSFKPLGEILKGLIGIAVAGPAFLVFITAIPGILLMAAVGAMAPLITLGFTALSTGIKMMDISVIGKGLLGIAALGLSIIPFAFAMSLFSDVNWTGVMAGAAALVVFAAAAFGLGALLAGPGAIIFGAGVIGIAALGVAMLPLAYAAKLAAEGFALMNDVDLINIGLGLSTLSGAVLAFGASMAGGGMLSFLGGGMMLQLVALAAISPALNNASMALSSIGGTLQMFKDEAVVEGIENITEAIKGLNAEINNVNLLNVAGLALLGNTTKGAAGTAGGGGGDEVVAKLDELIGLMRSGGIAVNIDGTKVSTAVGVATRLRGTF